MLEGGEWYTPSEEQTFAIFRALHHKVRREIFRKLESPMRKYEIAKFVHESFGRKYSRSLIEHHLKLLKQAGLIDYQETQEGKLVIRTCDVRLQLRSRKKPPSELLEKLKRVRT